MKDVQGLLSLEFPEYALVSMASWQKYTAELKQDKDFSTENIIRHIL